MLRWRTRKDFAPASRVSCFGGRFKKKRSDYFKEGNTDAGEKPFGN